MSNWRLSRGAADEDGQTNTTLVPLLEECGVLVVSDGGKDGSYDIIERCALAAKLHDIPVQHLEAPDLERDYGSSFCVPDTESSTMKGLLEPGAGFVRPELAIQYAIDDALANGAEVVENTVVTNLVVVVDDGHNDEVLHYLIQTSDGNKYKTKGVIVTVGAWASKIVPELDPFLTVTRQIQAWFELSPLSSESPSSTTTTLPSVGWFLDSSKHEVPVYGIPADPFSDHPHRSKIALHGRTEVFDPETASRPAVSDEELSELKDTIRDWIPIAADTIVESKACLYTMTPDGNFIVDRCDLMRLERTTRLSQRCKGEDRNSITTDIKESASNVWYAAGLSGHGFKMAPALGEALADLVIAGETHLPVGFLRKDRLVKCVEYQFECQKSIK